MTTTVRIICFTLLLSAFSFRAAAEDFTNAIRAFLLQRVVGEIQLTKPNHPCSQNIKIKF